MNLDLEEEWNIPIWVKMTNQQKLFTAYTISTDFSLTRS